MVGIGTDHIELTRRLPIDGGSLADVLARLRAETSGTILRWNLGARGSCEIDVSFSGRPAEGIGFTTSAKFWGPGRVAGASVQVVLVACEDDESQLEFHPAATVGDWWCDHISAFLDLAHAALEELAQELLWQHARVRDELAS
jgi:hypothetical protein